MSAQTRGFVVGLIVGLVVCHLMYSSGGMMKKASNQGQRTQG